MKGKIRDERASYGILLLDIEMRPVNTTRSEGTGLHLTFGTVEADCEARVVSENLRSKPDNESARTLWQDGYFVKHMNLWIQSQLLRCPL